MGIRLAPEQLKQLGRHVDLMLKWNKSINLTAITDPDEVAEKHVLDSLAVVPVLPSGSLLDAGTGAGFPGIPAAIAGPDLEVVLVDSMRSDQHTSELQSQSNLVCRLLLEKKKKKKTHICRA